MKTKNILVILKINCFCLCMFIHVFFINFFKNLTPDVLYRGHSITYEWNIIFYFIFYIIFNALNNVKTWKKTFFKRGLKRLNKKTYWPQTLNFTSKNKLEMSLQHKIFLFCWKLPSLFLLFSLMLTFCLFVLQVFICVTFLSFLSFSLGFICHLVTCRLQNGRNELVGSHFFILSVAYSFLPYIWYEIKMTKYENIPIE